MYRIVLIRIMIYYLGIKSKMLVLIMQNIRNGQYRVFNNMLAQDTIFGDYGVIKLIIPCYEYLRYYHYCQMLFAHVILGEIIF